MSQQEEGWDERDMVDFEVEKNDVEALSDASVKMRSSIWILLRFTQKMMTNGSEMMGPCKGETRESGKDAGDNIE